MLPAGRCSLPTVLDPLLGSYPASLLIRGKRVTVLVVLNLRRMSGVYVVAKEHVTTFTYDSSVVDSEDHLYTASSRFIGSTACLGQKSESRTYPGRHRNYYYVVASTGTDYH